MLDNNKIAGFVLTLLTVGHSSFACFISFIVSVISLHHLCLNRTNRDDKIIILQCVNLYFLVLIYTIMVTLFHTQTILGDLYEQNFRSDSCTFVGYFLLVISSAIYIASVMQAFYRLSRVVYQQHRWLQRFRLYVILPFIQMIVSLSLVSPLYLWKVVIYLPGEHYCFVPFTNFRGILWAVFSVYVIPIVCILIIYFRITLFIKKTGNKQTTLIRRKQERDVIAIRRILLTVALLSLAGAPTAFFLIRLIITGNIHPLTFRVAWLAASVSMAGLSMALVFIIPQLKSIVWKKNIQNRRNLTNDTTSSAIEMKNIINNR